MVRSYWRTRTTCMDMGLAIQADAMICVVKGALQGRSSEARPLRPSRIGKYGTRCTHGARTGIDRWLVHRQGTNYISRIGTLLRTNNEANEMGRVFERAPVAAASRFVSCSLWDAVRYFFVRSFRFTLGQDRVGGSLMGCDATAFFLSRRLRLDSGQRRASAHVGHFLFGAGTRQGPVPGG